MIEIKRKNMKILGKFIVVNKKLQQKTKLSGTKLPASLETLQRAFGRLEKTEFSKNN